MEPKDRIIVALDAPTLEEAAELTSMLRTHVGMFKVGLELLTWVGSVVVTRTFKDNGAKVFYDGKFMDIPNTVAGASKAVASLGVDMFNVHASGGVDMMRAAVENKGSSKVLAVTVLTSLDEDACVNVYGGSPDTVVPFFAKMAMNAGVDGIICSPKELRILKLEKELGHLIMVTPGVRPAWASVGDQKRVMTPGEAIKAGADYLVIGRPITKPPKEIGTPVDAAKLIAKEIEEALK